MDVNVPSTKLPSGEFRTPKTIDEYLDMCRDFQREVVESCAYVRSTAVTSKLEQAVSSVLSLAVISPPNDLSRTTRLQREPLMEVSGIPLLAGLSESIQIDTIVRHRSRLRYLRFPQRWSFAERRGNAQTPVLSLAAVLLPPKNALDMILLTIPWFWMATNDLNL